MDFLQWRDLPSSSGGLQTHIFLVWPWNRGGEERESNSRLSWIVGLPQQGVLGEGKEVGEVGSGKGKTKGVLQLCFSHSWTSPLEFAVGWVWPNTLLPKG